MKDLPITMIPDGWMEKTGGYARDMTLRDYFAAKAMQQLMKERGERPMQMVVDFAYSWADAMIEAGK